MVSFLDCVKAEILNLGGLLSHSLELVLMLSLSLQAEVFGHSMDCKVDELVLSNNHW